MCVRGCRVSDAFPLRDESITPLIDKKEEEREIL